MFTTSTGRLHPVWAFVVSAMFSVLAFLVAGYAAGAMAGDRVLLFELIFRPLLALLLIALFVWMLATVDHLENHRIAAMGLPRAPGWLRQFTTGCVLGFLLTVLAIIPIAIWGQTSSRFRLSLHTLPRVGAVLLVLLLGALAEELIFRGYPFQHLEQGIGAIGAITVFSVMFGAVHLANPGASLWGLINTILIGILLSISYLRTRALWLPWGIHFGWNFALGFLFGLPVSGLRLFNVMVRTTASGPQWVTGGNYGLEASATAVVVILVGVVMVWKLPLARLAQPASPMAETVSRDRASGIEP
ncbi:MAG: CPBP family intramembrane glutamic endopeptidase [Candidatus Korobacteraceae bacterium]